MNDIVQNSSLGVKLFFGSSSRAFFLLSQDWSAIGRVREDGRGARFSNRQGPEPALRYRAH